ncbi:MAG: GNAT family N-acetyltransferase, partial [Acidimicrobiia bacterium]
MADTITTRQLDDADVLPVLDLLRAALGEPPLLRRTPELFAWKHFDNPFGRSLAVVAETDNRIVGLRAFMRWVLVTPDGSTLR